MKLLDKCIGSVSTFGMMSLLTAQDVPKKVEIAFAHRFPSIDTVEWEKETGNSWEAGFKMRNLRHDVLFHDDGT